MLEVMVEDSKITLPTAKQMKEIREILLQNRLIRLANFSNWRMVFRRRFRRNSPSWLNKLIAFLENLPQFLPIFNAFVSEIPYFCYQCKTPLNTVGVITTEEIQGQTKKINHEKYFPNLVAYCLECNFVIELYENIWAEDH